MRCIYAMCQQICMYVYVCRYQKKNTHHMYAYMCVCVCACVCACVCMHIYRSFETLVAAQALCALDVQMHLTCTGMQKLYVANVCLMCN